MRRSTALVCAGLAGLFLAAERPAYSPIASPAATRAATASSVKLVRSWLDEKDFASAAEAAQGLKTLAQLYGYQGDDADWLKRSAALQQACNRLHDAIARKSVVDCEKSATECSRFLDDLARNPPAGAKRTEKTFKPFGTTKTWMLLMDGAYVDTKRAETAREVELLSLAIAEEANVVGFLREDRPWRTSADEVRDTALRAAKLAADNDLSGARKTLKEMHRRCEVCHERLQK
jgi:hypothetical protein